MVQQTFDIKRVNPIFSLPFSLNLNNNAHTTVVSYTSMPRLIDWALAYVCARPSTVVGPPRSCTTIGQLSFNWKLHLCARPYLKMLSATYGAEW
jgi:hypothetical protein